MQLTILHVFVSSTWLDLQPEREAVETALQRLRETKFVGMEYFGSRDEDTRRASLDEVDRSQVYVGIIGGRYGSGITEAEYHRARELGLPCFIYCKDEAAIPPEGCETDPEKATLLAALKVELRQHHTVTTFTTPDDLAAKVTADLHRWLFDKYLAPRLEQAVQQGNLAEIRRLAEATRDEAALRQALTQRGITVGRDVTESLLVLGDHNVISFFVQGITRLPTDYASRIQNFLTEYLGTPGQPVPFGGRDADLARLEAWLADPHAPPYLLLAAPAGRGKSALLVRWSQRLLAQNDASLVFVPVSIRFRTNLAPVVFAALAARLAHLHGEEVSQTTDLTAEQWRGLVSTYLARPLPDGRSLLLILDGVDEAADWEPGPDLFPLDPPPGLRVIVSARYRAGDADADPWLRRLGWERPSLARPLDLAPLVRAGVADVLQKMGFPLDVLARDVDIVTELHRLSEGDPLLVRLYVDDLWARGEAAARLRPKDLRTIRPGLRGYFDRWWEDQRRLWGADAPLKEPAVQALLNLLTCALGPLNREDVMVLAGDVGLTTWALEEALRPLARFVIGDGKTQGYVFGHPRLGEYFHRGLTDAERLAWEQRFLDWGKQTLMHLEDGTLVADQAPVYVMQYYGAHLERGGGSAEPLFALVSDGWRRAWEALEGAYTGFLTDVERAWRAARVVNGMETTRGGVAPHLGVEVRSALCQASVNSLARNIPPVLLAALVKQGMWTAAQGLAYARQVPEPGQQAEALARLVPYLPQAEHAEALKEALAAAWAIQGGWARAWVLAKLAPHLSKELMREALAAAREIEWEWARAEALAGLAPHLLEALFGEALAAARQIQYEDDLARALAGLAPYLPEVLLKETLAAARTIESEWRRAEVLALLASRMAELGHPQEALAVAREIEDEDDRAEALARLAPHLPEAERAEVLRGALARARSIKDGRPPEETTAWLAPHLPETERAEALREALAAAREIGDADDRVEALAGLAPHLPEALLREELAAVRTIRDEGRRAEALAGLAPHLPEALLKGALSAAREIKGEWRRAEVLARLAPHLLEALLKETLATAWEIDNEWARAKALVGLAPKLAELGHPKEALSAARVIRGEDDRAEVLARLAPYLPEAERTEALREVLAATRVIGSEDDRAKALAGLASHLPEALLREALVAVREIRYESSRAKALAGLAPHLPASLLREALAVAREIRYEDDRAKVLAGLARRLAELGYHQEALAAAREIGDPDDRAEVLAGLASHLPEPERAKALREALAAVWEIWDADDWAEALAELAPHLSEAGRAEALREALAAAREIRYEGDRAEALARLAPHLPQALLREALTVAREIQYEGGRSKALAGLAPHLPKPLLEEALAAARETGSEWQRAEALAALAPRLAELGYPQQALVVAREIGHVDDRARGLAGLVPHLSEAGRAEALREALAAAREIRYKGEQAKALVGLASYLSETERAEVLGEALAVAQAIEGEWERARALSRLTPWLAELGHPGEALAVARAIKSERRRTEALAGLAPRLAELGRPEEALVAAQEIGDADDRAEALAGLAPRLAELGHPEEALVAAQEIGDADNRAEVLARLVPHLAQLPRQRLYPLWQETLPILATRTRKDLLADLCALEPVIAALGGPEAVAETFRAIQDVGRWWP